MPEPKVGSRRQARSGAAATRMTRADRTQETRRKLIDAAAKVVGEEGYANASVAKITALADVAQGTFYNYFASQQDLFDHLLPELGSELLDLIRDRLVGITQSEQREEIGFRAFFEFLADRPEFYRILNEAETFSPTAFHGHMRNMADGYLRALTRARSKGELPGFEPRELEVIVYALLAARSYLSYRYIYRDGVGGRLPDWVSRAYLKLVSGGMVYGGTNGRTHRPRRAPATESQRFDIECEITNAADGRTIATVDIVDEHRDENGAVRRAVMLQLFDRTSMHAAVTVAGTEAQLLNLASSFMGPATGQRLVARAQPELRSGLVHVTVKIEEIGEAGATAQPVATALAVFASSDPSDSRKQ